jgi:hypothetical protein
MQKFNACKKRDWLIHFFLFDQLGLHNSDLSGRSAKGNEAKL